MKILIFFVSLCFLLTIEAHAQKKPVPVVKELKKTPPKKKPSTKKTIAPKTSKTPAGEKPNIQKTEESPVREAAPDTSPILDDQESEENLRRLEKQNRAESSDRVRQVSTPQMNRASFTVLPVILYAPGLHDRNKSTGKPVYTPQHIFNARKIKAQTGDVMVSEKYFYNKIKFDTQKMVSGILQDSTQFYSFTGLKYFRNNSGPQIGQKIGDYLTNNNVGTDVLKIWTNKSILMNRIQYSMDEVHKRELVDPKKLSVFENLLRKNYVMVMVLINPKKETTHDKDGGSSDYYSADIEGFLYQVDTTALNINKIRDKHPLKFIKQISLSNQNCDPRNEQTLEVLGNSTVEGAHAKIKQLIATGIVDQADYFYKSKSYACAKSYYEYILSAKLKNVDERVLKNRIEEISRQISKGRGFNADNTCLINEATAYEDWVFAQGATNHVIQNLERGMDELMVKSFVFKTKPYISVEIGKKQGVYTDQRYTVYRKTLSEDGKNGRKRIGTIRAVKVASNTDKFKAYDRNRPTGLRASHKTGKAASDSARVKTRNSSFTELRARSARKDSLKQTDLTTMSIFKQTDGGNIEPFDQVVQSEDYGIGIQVGYGTRIGVAATVLGGDVRLASILKSRMPFAGIKIGANVGLLKKSAVEEKWNITAKNPYLIDMYLARESYLNRHFDLKPLIGVSLFNEKYNVLFGLMAYINLAGKNTTTKIKLAPEVSYVAGYSLQGSLSLRFDF